MTSTLYDTTHCPRVGVCESCGTEIDVSTLVVEYEMGPYCLRLCQRCDRYELVPQLASWTTAAERIVDHCDHLGISVRRMYTIQVEEGSL